MIMQDQSKRLSEPLRWGRREKTAVAILLSCLVVALIGLGAYALTTGGGGSTEQADCIRVNFASTLGGADLHGCGPQARRICASGSFRNIQPELREACRKAGFPYVAPTG
jgi:hypothetical protein